MKLRDALLATAIPMLKPPQLGVVKKIAFNQPNKTTIIRNKESGCKKQESVFKKGRWLQKKFF
jgi:hypothetical protein